MKSSFLAWLQSHFCAALSLLFHSMVLQNEIRHAKQSRPPESVKFNFGKGHGSDDQNWNAKSNVNHPSIFLHLSEVGSWGSRLSREAQTSFSPATSLRSQGIPSQLGDMHSLLAMGYPRGLIAVGRTQNTSPGQYPSGIHHMPEPPHLTRQCRRAVALPWVPDDRASLRIVIRFNICKQKKTLILLNINCSVIVL